MSNIEECTDYFKKQPEWKRYFSLIRKKWESYGRVGGKIVLTKATAEEQKVAERFLGRHIRTERVEISLQEFENALARTKFAPITLKELLDCYFGEEIKTKQEQAERLGRDKQLFFERLFSWFETKQENFEQALSWVHIVFEQKKYGYSLLMAEWAESEEAAELLVKNVGAGLAMVSSVQASGIPLAVLAAEVTGNPHYFDRGSTPGNLLVNALCCSSSLEYPQTAYAWRELLLQHGILPDEVSNTVLVYGLHLETEKGCHPAFEGFCQMREPGVLLSSALKGIRRAYGESEEVFIVENEMVFSYLVENFSEEPVTLLCTSGQPRTVSLKLMELLVKNGSSLYYSGDIDPEGIKIADRLWQKFSGGVHIWRMGVKDYEKAVSEERVNERRLAILDHIVCPELQEVSACLKEKERAAYQEKLLSELSEDIKERGKW